MEVCGYLPTPGQGSSSDLQIVECRQSVFQYFQTCPQIFFLLPVQKVLYIRQLALFQAGNTESCDSQIWPGTLQV